ncbi:MAG: hypothetical protein RL885_29810 [Planctomycetota bacterium]
MALVKIGFAQYYLGCALEAIGQGPQKGDYELVLSAVPEYRRYRFKVCEERDHTYREFDRDEDFPDYEVRHPVARDDLFKRKTYLVQLAQGLFDRFADAIVHDSLRRQGGGNPLERIQYANAAVAALNVLMQKGEAPSYEPIQETCVVTDNLSVPEAKARRLLREIVPEDEFRRYEREMCVDLTKGERRYRIHRNFMVEVFEGEKKVFNACLQFRRWGCPPTDAVVMRYLHILHREKDFLAKANLYRIES